MPASLTSAPAVVVDGVRLSWPDGTPALVDVSCTFPAARTGLIGENGEFAGALSILS